MRGPNVMRGYLNSEANARFQALGGWYDTGDIVKVDTDGFVFILGRAGTVNSTPIQRPRPRTSLMTGLLSSVSFARKYPPSSADRSTSRSSLITMAPPSPQVKFLVS